MKIVTRMIIIMPTRPVAIKTIITIIISTILTIKKKSKL